MYIQGVVVNIIRSHNHMQSSSYTNFVFTYKSLSNLRFLMVSNFNALNVVQPMSATRLPNWKGSHAIVILSCNVFISSSEVSYNKKKRKS